ncbi:hypothetical protein INS49_011153 [Diaporthe citri]|uniref:uncharacterized protein n=1 Tax=Diaporthe citri TaxID=83186 RepID=UPI001C81F7BA|nr:uncharacterized protein INS49_011153 [Diaporthe citri]KAG6360097.1 hypothetical protein INS49_011153 [Diaporthe citri]
MAVIEELGLEVKVNVNGSAAAECPDEEPDVNNNARRQTANVCHRYVESVDNAGFAINVGLIPGTNTGQEWVGRSQNHGLSFTVAFDGGHNVATVVIRQRRNTELLEGVHVEDANKKRVASDLKVAQNLGLIRVSVRRIIFKNKDQSHTSSHHLRLGTQGISLAEKALKGRAVSHGAALSAPVQSTNWDTYHFDCVDTYASPLAVFYFKYRSKEALQQQLIIPRPRSLSMESDLENISPDEIRRLARERLSQIKDGKKRAICVKDEDDTKIINSDNVGDN